MNSTWNSLLSLCLRMITLIRVAQLMSRPFVPPSVSLQTNLWKYKSCEQRDQLTPHLSVSPSVCVSSFHHLHPSLSQSTHQQQWCAVIIVRASLRSSVCLHARPRRVVMCLPVCLHTCMYLRVCVLYVCDVTNLHLEEPLTSIFYQYVELYHPAHMLGLKKKDFPTKIWLCSSVSQFVPQEDVCCSLFLRLQLWVPVFCCVWSPLFLLSYLRSKERSVFSDQPLPRRCRLWPWRGRVRPT